MKLEKIKKKPGSLPCGRPVPDWREAGYTSKEKRFTLFKIKLDNFVSQAKLNQSEPREQILQVVAQYESHFTSSQLIAKVNRMNAKIGPATVYRSIQIFIQSGILRETLAKDTGEKVFEVESTQHHDHIVCLDCDSILEFHEPQIETLQLNVLGKLGFREARHRHVIYAHCEFKKL